MKYHYKCGNETIDVLLEKVMNGDVAVVQHIDGNNYSQPIRNLDGRRVFMWNDNIIDVTSWVKPSLQDVVGMLSHNEDISVEAFCNAVITEGINNVRFNVKWSPSSRKETYMIVERPNRSVSDMYKLELRPVNDPSSKNAVDLWILDMLRLVKCGDLKIYSELW